jgi:hypothetical protein
MFNGSSVQIAVKIAYGLRGHFPADRGRINGVAISERTVILNLFFAREQERFEPLGLPKAIALPYEGRAIRSEVRYKSAVGRFLYPKLF